MNKLCKLHSSFYEKNINFAQVFKNNKKMKMAIAYTVIALFSAGKSVAFRIEIKSLK